MIPKIELIQWIDSGLFVSEGFMNTEEVISKGTYDHMLVETVGYFVFEDDDRIMLSMTYDEGLDAHMNTQVIWRSAIQSRTTVRHEEP